MPEPTLYECECCDLPLCERKIKGMGYYCNRCVGHEVWQQDCGRPGARHANFEDCMAEINAEHAAMAEADCCQAHLLGKCDAVFTCCDRCPTFFERPANIALRARYLYDAEFHAAVYTYARRTRDAEPTLADARAVAELEAKGLGWVTSQGGPS